MEARYLSGFPYLSTSSFALGLRPISMQTAHNRKQIIVFNRIIAGLGILSVLGVFYLIGSSQVEFGEGIVLLVILALFVLPGLIRLTR